MRLRNGVKVLLGLLSAIFLSVPGISHALSLTINGQSISGVACPPGSYTGCMAIAGTYTGFKINNLSPSTPARALFTDASGTGTDLLQLISLEIEKTTSAGPINLTLVQDFQVVGSPNPENSTLALSGIWKLLVAAPPSHTISANAASDTTAPLGDVLTNINTPTGFLPVQSTTISSGTIQVFPLSTGTAPFTPGGTTGVDFTARFRSSIDINSLGVGDKVRGLALTLQFGPGLPAGAGCSEDEDFGCFDLDGDPSNGDETPLPHANIESLLAGLAPETSEVPEPSTWILFASGLAAFWVFRRKTVVKA